MEESKQPRIIIIGMGDIGKAHLMKLFYNLVVSDPNEILNYKESLSFKVKKLNDLLKFFEELEEFEKCAEIKRVKDLIILNDSENSE